MPCRPGEIVWAAELQSLAVWSDSEPEGEQGRPLAGCHQVGDGFDVVPEQAGPVPADLVVRLVWVGVDACPGSIGWPWNQVEILPVPSSAGMSVTRTSGSTVPPLSRP